MQARLVVGHDSLWTIEDPARPLWEPSRRQFERWMGALAVDWLVQWTGEAALQQYAQTRFAGDWRAAFQDAFGMSIDQFLSWFEHYRQGLTAADGGAPRLRRPFHSVVFAGPLTDERRALVPAIEAFVDFFEREYGLSATAATFVLDIDEASYKDIWAGVDTCGYANGSLIYVRAECAFPFIIAHEFAHVLQKELARGGEWPQQWLVEGSAEYLAMQQSLDAGPADPETAWASREAFAAGVITGVPATASDAAVARAALERDELYQVYALAVRHLVARFGIEPLFAAFGPTWRDAGPDEASRFQAVFGASLDDFHASFGRWLRSLPAPPPAEPDPDGVQVQVCPVVWADAQGVFQVVLDGPGPNCTLLHSGGHVAVSRGDSVRTFTLYRGYGWAIIDETHVFGTAAATFFVVDPSVAPRGGEITLALGDGRELARRVPPELADLHAVFDAITSSPGG